MKAIAFPVGNMADSSQILVSGSVEPSSVFSFPSGSFSTEEAQAAAEYRRERDRLNDLVKDRIGRLKKAYELRSDERALQEKAAKFLEEDQRQCLWKNPAETDAHWDEKLKITVSLPEFILRRVANLYSAAPSRSAAVEQVELGDMSEDQAVEAKRELDEQRKTINSWLHSHVWDFGVDGIDTTMQDVDFWSLYLGTAAVEPRYQGEWAFDDTDGVEALYYRAHEFEVIYNRADPRIPEAILLFIGYVDTSLPLVTGDQSMTTTKRWHYWDGDCFCTLNGWTIDETEGAESTDSRWHKGVFNHGIGFCPVQVVTERLEGAYINLFPQAKAINKLYTELWHSWRVQAHGYVWSKGRLNSTFLSADAVIECGEDGQLGVASGGGNVDGVLRGLQDLLNRVCMSFDMAPGTLRMDPGEARSGTAIKAEQAETDRVRRARLPRFQRFEQRLHRSSLAVYEAFTQTDFPFEQRGVVIEYRPPESALERESRAAEAKQMWLDGLISRMEYARMMSPDLSDDEIERRIAEADEERRKAQEAEAASRALAVPSNPFERLGEQRRRDIAETPQPAGGNS